MKPDLSTTRWQRFIRSKATKWVVVGVAVLVAAEFVCRSSLPPGPEGQVMAPHISLLWTPDEETLCRPEWPPATGEGGGRTILFLGDSSVYGAVVLPEQAFPRQVEARAKGRLRTGNCGAPGYSTLQSLRVLEMVLPEQVPDLLVIANLWSDNNLDTFVDKELMAQREGTSFRLFFTLNRWLSHSSVWQLLLRVAGQARPTNVAWGNHRSAQISGQRRVSISDYATNLDAMVDRAESVGAEVLFVLLANEEDLAETQRVWPWHPYREVMRDVASHRGYPVISVPDLYRSTGLKPSSLFLDEMHPSVEGHQRIADAILATLEARGWAEGGALRDPSAPGTSPSVRLDPVVSSAPRDAAPSTPYSIAGVLLMPLGGEGPSMTLEQGKPRYRLDAVADTVTGPVVVDAVTVPRASAFVLTVSPPRRVTLRLTAGTLRHGVYEWQAPRKLRGGEMDLREGPVWGLTVLVDEAVVRPIPALPGNWQELLEVAPSSR